MYNKHILLIAVAFSLIPNSYSHENGEYEMNYANWLAYHPDIEHFENNKEVECKTKSTREGQYKEINLGNSLHIHKRINSYAKNASDKDIYNFAMDGWLNTLGVQAGDLSQIFHDKPSLPRNQYSSKNIGKIIANIAKHGVVEYFYEVNSYRYGTVMSKSRGVPKGYHLTVTITNPDEIAKCFELD